MTRLVGPASLSQYMGDEKLRLAVERALQIVGEAASQVPRAFREGQPEIEWARIVGLRHILVHGYTKVDQEIIREIVTSKVPELIAALGRLIPPPPENAS